MFSKLSFRIPAVVILASLLGAFSVGVFGFLAAKDQALETAEENLQALRASRSSALSNEFQKIERELDFLAHSNEASNALEEFTANFEFIKPYQDTSQLEILRAALQSAGGSEQLSGDPQFNQAILSYIETHNFHHSWLESYRELGEYYDLLLVSQAGDVVYATIKEIDFGSNLISGPLSDSGLSRAYQNARDNQPYLEDFAPYAPSDNQPAAFIAEAVVRDGIQLGVVIVQLPIERIDAVMQVTAGMGRTGETYLVGADGLMRSDSRFSETSSVLLTRADTAASRSALSGLNGVETIIDYRGVSVLSAYQPVEVFQNTWALLAEIDSAEIRAPIEAMQVWFIAIGLGVGALVAVLGTVLVRSMIHPLQVLTDNIVAFRTDHQDFSEVSSSRKDEIGEIDRAFTATAAEIVSVISQLKEARASLESANIELEELNELKNKFMGMAAHDLRNPLSAIRGMSDMILALDLEAEKEKEFIVSISKVSTQMLSLLNDLLDVSAIESGTFEVNLEPYDLCDLVRDRAELSRYSAKTKSIDIAVSEHDSPKVNIDTQKFAQVLDNILSNAIKFSPEQSTIEVEVRTRGQSAEVLITDHGQGIPPEEIEQVFSPFNKLSPKPTAGEKSTGLGMSIVKKLIEVHSGSVALASELGVGTQVTITLPITD